MKKTLSLLLIFSLFVLSTASLAAAGPRHSYYGYNGHYRGYNDHYRPYRYGHGHHSDHFLGYLGVGLLTGAVVGTILSTPPRERVVYTTPPPVILQSEPIIVTRPPAYVSPDREVVLRQVRITVHSVNVRSGPGLDSGVIGQAVEGQTLDVIGAAPDWLYVKTSTGQYGWVMAQYTVESQGPVG
jgi:uncharacterized protein YgiM (DUF1202 family)